MWSFCRKWKLSWTAGVCVWSSPVMEAEANLLSCSKPSATPTAALSHRILTVTSKPKAALFLYVTLMFSSCRWCHDISIRYRYCTVEFISFPKHSARMVAYTRYSYTQKSLTHYTQELAGGNLSIADQYVLINWPYHHGNHHLALYLQPFIIQSY